MYYLRHFYEGHKNIGEAFIKLKRDIPLTFESRDHDRRLVKSFYMKIFWLKQFGLLRKKDLRRFLSKEQVCFFIVIIRPLEEKINPERFDKKPFEFFLELYPDAEDPKFLLPI